MTYDPTKPRETSKPAPPPSKKKSSGSLASMFGFNLQTQSAAALPSEGNPYGQGLGYDPVKPRSTARGSSWVDKYTTKSPASVTTNNRMAGIGAFLDASRRNPYGGSLRLSQKGQDAIYAQNPDWEPTPLESNPQALLAVLPFMMRSGGGVLSF